MSSQTITALDTAASKIPALTVAAPEPAAPDAIEETWRLVEAAQTGNSAAFGELYDRYASPVFRYISFRLGNRHLAEDLTSETFLRALRRIDSVSYRGHDVGAWFITIARNLVLDHVKSSRYRLEIVTDELAESDDSSEIKVGPATPLGPEQQVLTQALRAELLRCIAALGEDQRDCVVLRFIQGLSVTETAAVMSRSEGAVKALQHRAIRKLAQTVSPGCRE